MTSWDLHLLSLCYYDEDIGLVEFVLLMGIDHFPLISIDSEDGKLSCGYSSFRGKRVTMEDFYDIKTSNIDGETVCMFGIFDG